MVETQSEEQSTKSPQQDAVRTRMRLFTEGVVKMVSPVLLALGLNKVDLKGQGSDLVRASVFPIAALAMACSMGIFLLLWLCLSKPFTGLEWLQHAASKSKILIYLCSILVMSLASVILLLISMDYELCLMGVPLLMAFILVICCLCGVCRQGGGKAAAKKNATPGCECDDRELESSVEFSAAFTALLFLGLERLALELQKQQMSNSDAGMAHDHLKYCLAVSFFTCVLGMVIMLVWTVPPPISDGKAMPVYIEASNVVLALFITGIVLTTKIGHFVKLSKRETDFIIAFLSSS